MRKRDLFTVGGPGESRQVRSERIERLLRREGATADGKKPGMTEGYPSTRNLMLMLTRACQMGCKYCHLTQEGPSLPRATMRRAIDLLLRGPDADADIQFFGGEPLLRSDLLAEGADYAHRRAKALGKRVFCSVATNGLLLDAKRLDFLIRHDIRAILSLDGDAFTQKEHRPLLTRGRPYPTRRLLANVRRALRSAWHVQLSMVVRPPSVPRLQDNARYIADLGAPELDILYEVGTLWREEDIRGYLVEMYGLLSRMRGEGVGMRLANFNNVDDEPLLNSRGVTVDTDGKVYIGCTLPVEMVLPELKKTNHVGRVSGLKSFKDLRRSRSAHRRKMVKSLSRRKEGAELLASNLRLGDLSAAFFSRVRGDFPEFVPD